MARRRRTVETDSVIIGRAAPQPGAGASGKFRLAWTGFDTYYRHERRSAHHPCIRTRCRSRDAVGPHQSGGHFHIQGVPPLRREPLSKSNGSVGSASKLAPRNMPWRSIGIRRTENTRLFGTRRVSGCGSRLGFRALRSGLDQRLPSATMRTKSGERKPISTRSALSVAGESFLADCSSLAVVGQATQAAAIAMPKVESGMPTFEVT